MPRIWWVFLIAARWLALGCWRRRRRRMARARNWCPGLPINANTPTRRNAASILHVVVTDASGQPVTGLKPEDFTILDHAQSQKIARFEEVNESTGNK